MERQAKSEGQKAPQDPLLVVLTPRLQLLLSLLAQIKEKYYDRQAEITLNGIV